MKSRFQMFILSLSFVFGKERAKEPKNSKGRHKKDAGDTRNRSHSQHERATFTYFDGNPWKKRISAISLSHCLFYTVPSSPSRWL